ncbi:MAG: type VI secretion system secreted protein VgrG, partial [Pseudohongiellaceae bacterium]
MRTQQQNLIRLQTALGKDAFFVTHLNASLAMSSMEHFILNAYSDTLHNVQPTEIIGTSATITVFGENGAPQYFDSYVTAFKKGSPALTGQGTPYTIELKPWLHFLDHESDCRIFQNMTVTDVLDKILAPYGGMGAYSLSLSNPHPLKRYQVQYNETNLAFFNRICHYSGLAYYIEHSNGSHILNVIDTDGPLGSLSPAVLDYQAGTAIRDHLSTWERNSRYATGNFEQRSYNYKIPSNLLINNQPASGEIAGVPRVPDTSHYRYIEDFDNQGDMSASSTTRITQVTSSRHAVSAGGDYRCLKVGKNFSAKPIPGSSPFPDKGKPFTIVQLSLTATNDSEFQSTLGAIPKGELCYPHYEPSLIHSLQTAVVTGPPGEEIYTDQEGRIKVQFHWDRLGKKDQDSTCWLRVMQSFSGPEFGGHFTPRIGQEVVVAFENGNPDRPFVLGGLHHTEHIPPFVIDNGLRAGFRTRSSKGGAIKQCNEISFYDAMGSEEFFIHAQKDHNSKILHNRAERIDNHEIASIGGNRSLEVEGNQQQKVGGAMNLSIGGGPGSSVLGMVAGVLAAGSGDAMKGSGGVGN